MPVPLPVLLELLQQWRRATAAEARAIQDEAWPVLAEVQESKRRLQGLIAPAVDQLKIESPAAGRHPSTISVSGIIAELVAEEQANLDALEKKMAELRRQQAGLDQAGRRLRQIHRTYAPGRSPAWQSYS